MKKHNILMLLFVLFFNSCTSTLYRYDYVNLKRKQNYTSFYIRKLKIHNAESLMMNESVISNVLADTFDLVMLRNGFGYDTNANLRLDFDFYVEDNDLVNNRQAISMLFKFYDGKALVASFLLSSKSKDLLLNKSLLVSEIENIATQLKGKERYEKNKK